MATPYSDPDPAVREHRFREACRATAALIRAGHVVFCPVVHFHPLVEHGLPTEWAAWERIDREFLRRCDEVLVLTLDGWEESVGVSAELKLAIKLRIPVRHAALVGLTIQIPAPPSDVRRRSARATRRWARFD